MNQLFFELIQVAIGTRIYLSRTPTVDEWGKLYAMAKKQSLVGVCFAGVQRLQMQRQTPEEMLYITWMGMAAKIQQRNETVNRQCVDLQKRLSIYGFRSCILKGQGVAASYGSLSLLRQSGDIDLWIDGSPEGTITRLEIIGIELININIKHAEAKVFSDTEVEIHFTPSWFYNPLTSRRFKAWIKATSDDQMRHEYCGLVVPTAEFNVVYLLLHIYRHLLDEGVGMRQLMDYFFALEALPSSQKKMCYETICNFGMKRIVSAVMWIMQEVFGIDQEHLLCAVDGSEGALLLKEVITAGNFGHHDECINHEHRGAVGRGWMNYCRNMRFVTRYPGEVLCAPFWKIWHWGWRKRFN